jgi:hypothetical protein
MGLAKTWWDGKTGFEGGGGDGARGWRWRRRCTHGGLEGGGGDGASGWRRRRRCAHGGSTRSVGSREVTATGLKGGGGEDGACAVGALSQWRLGFN